MKNYAYKVILFKYNGECKTDFCIRRTVKEAYINGMVIGSMYPMYQVVAIIANYGKGYRDGQRILDVCRGMYNVLIGTRMKDIKWVLNKCRNGGVDIIPQNSKKCSGCMKLDIYDKFCIECGSTNKKRKYK